jgi:hypothetical protein
MQYKEVTLQSCTEGLGNTLTVLLFLIFSIARLVFPIVRVYMLVLTQLIPGFCTMDRQTCLMIKT